MNNPSVTLTVGIVFVATPLPPLGVLCRMNVISYNPFAGPPFSVNLPWYVKGAGDCAPDIRGRRNAAQNIAAQCDFFVCFMLSFCVLDGPMKKTGSVLHRR